MTVEELIRKLKTFDSNATVWISDEQGGGGKANLPFRTKGMDFYSGEVAKAGDVVMTYENT